MNTHCIELEYTSFSGDGFYRGRPRQKFPSYWKHRGRSCVRPRCIDATSRGVVPRGARVAMAPPYFDRSINPISTRGADCAHLIITGTPDFQSFRRPCRCDGMVFPIKMIGPNLSNRGKTATSAQLTTSSSER